MSDRVTVHLTVPQAYACIAGCALVEAGADLDSTTVRDVAVAERARLALHTALGHAGVTSNPDGTFDDLLHAVDEFDRAWDYMIESDGELEEVLPALQRLRETYYALGPQPTPPSHL